MALQPIIKGEGKDFSFSQPEIMLQEASCSTVSLHTRVQLGVPHPPHSWCFSEMFFPSSTESRDWRETIKQTDPKVLSNAKATKLEYLQELHIS